MKLNLIVFFTISLLTSCEKEKNNTEIPNIKGYWVNISEKKDTLSIINDSIIQRSHFQSKDTGFYHEYRYTLKQDSIELVYLGMDKITFTKSFIQEFNYDQENNILRIENFEKVYPGYPGNEFKYLEKN